MTPVIVTIVVCFLLMAGLIIWQRKTTPSPQSADDLEKRLAEASLQLKQSLTKLSECDVELRASTAEIAGLKATNESLAPQLAAEKARSAALQAQIAIKQQELSKAMADLSAAETNVTALQRAEANVANRLAALEARSSSLQLERDSLSARAVTAETTIVGLHDDVSNRDSAIETMRIHQAKVRDELNSELIDSRTERNGFAERAIGAEQKLESQTEELQASRLAVRKLEIDIDKLRTETAKVLEESRLERNRFAERAVGAEQKIEGLNEELQTSRRLISNLQSDLDKTRGDLAASLAKQQADTDAARRFENIGQEILKTTLEEAKKGVGEITASMQKASSEDLERHAKSLALTLEPLQEKLKTYDETIDKFRLDSQNVYGGLTNQLKELQTAERDLHKQAQALTNALSSAPKVRGMYGEIILKQLVEFAGMQDRCHFDEQVSTNTPEGRKIPDMIVYLPGGQKVIIDAKATMNACVEAFESDDELQRKVLLKRHCDNVRSRINELSAKSYFSDHLNSVEAVVLFLPAENLYATAMENDPDLTQYAIERNIIVCGPNSLILLLKVANQVWQRASIEEDAKKIAERANEIYKHAYNFVTKFVSIGEKIKQLGSTYNDAAGTLDSRLIPAGRKMQEFDGIKADRELPELAYYVEDVRQMQSKEAKEVQKLSTKSLPELATDEARTELVLSSGDASTLVS